mgnify:FL=1
MNEQASRWWNVRQGASSRHAGETRKQLLLAAFEEIYRVGFQAASLQKILLRTGVTKGALYHHFPSKQALGHAVVDEIISVMLREQWIRPLETSTTPLLTMRQMILDAGSRMTGEDVRLGCPLNNLAQEMAPVDEGFRERIEAVYAEWRGAVAEALERGIASGKVRADIMPSQVATVYVAALEGCLGLAKTAQRLELLYECGEGLLLFLTTLENPAETRRD